MPKTEPGPNRHHFRIWIKMAIQSGLIDRLPPVYEPDGFQTPLRTDECARQLLAELRDPDSSRRTLKEIIASTRQFKSWVEARQKDGRHRGSSMTVPRSELSTCHPLNLESCLPMKEDRGENRDPINPTRVPDCIPCGTIGLTAWKDNLTTR